MEYLKSNGLRWLRHLIAAPFIYILVVPIAFFDLMITIYQAICFPLYRLPKVKRSKYVKIDRYKLGYLSLYQKFNCAYCEYANGLVRYASKIGEETERYWCGIQHEKDPNFIPPEHHKNFLPYNDKKAFEEFKDKCKLTKKH